MSTFAKYMERYKNRLKQEPEMPEVASSSRLTTDRNAYIAFLEIQLQRVSRSCSDIQRFQDKISQLESQITLTGERVAQSVHSGRTLEERVERIERVNIFQGQRKVEEEAFPWKELEGRITKLEEERVKKGDQDTGSLNARLAQLQIESTQRVKYETGEVLRKVKQQQRELESAVDKQGEDIATELHRIERLIRGHTPVGGDLDQDLLSSKLRKIESSMNACFEELEEQIKELHQDSRRNRKEIDKILSQFSTHRTGREMGRNEGMGKEELRRIRSLVTRKVQDGVDKMGTLVKGYLGSVKKMENRIATLERNSRPISRGYSPKQDQKRAGAPRPPIGVGKKQTTQKRSESTRPRTTGCSPSNMLANNRQMRVLSRKVQPMLRSSYSQEEQEERKEFKRSSPIRRIYSQRHERDYDRSLSQGAKILKDSLERMSRSDSKPRDSFWENRQSLHRHYQELDDTEDSTRFPEAKHHSPQRRLGGFVASRSRDHSFEVVQNLGAHSFNDSLRGALLDSGRRCHSDLSKRNSNIPDSKNQVTFSFSPYSTKRSRLVELQARLRRDKQTKRTLISQIVSESTPKFHHSKRSSKPPDSLRQQTPKYGRSGQRVSGASKKHHRIHNLYQEFAAQTERARLVR